MCGNRHGTIIMGKEFDKGRLIRRYSYCWLIDELSLADWSFAENSEDVDGKHDSMYSANV